MADEQAFDPVAAGAVAVDEPKFDPTQLGAIPVQHEEPSIPAKIGHAVVDTLKGFLPQSVEQAALAPITMVPGIGKVGQLLSNVAFGKPIGEGLDPLAGIPVAQRIPQITAAEKTAPYSQERFTAGIGTLADVAMLAGFKDVFNPKLAETAGIAKPDIAQPVEPVATDTAKTEPITPAEPDLTAVNRDLAPTTEPPSAISEPFPSLSQSAEDARRVEQQQPAPTIREAISLDEIRLMRERDELNAQNEIAKAATGGTHPAVDERLGQIDEQLTNIANKELQTVGSEPAPIQKQGGLNASEIPSPESVPVPTLREEVGGEAPLRQQGEATGTREGSPPENAGAATPEVSPEIPEGAKVTLNVRTPSGKTVPQEFGAKEAEGIFTKEKSSYQALLNCLGA